MRQQLHNYESMNKKLREKVDFLEQESHELKRVDKNVKKDDNLGLKTPGH